MNEFADGKADLLLSTTIIESGIDISNANTMIIIDHNLHVIKSADWVIDMGPEGGQGGGKVVACGTPEDVAKNKDSATGAYLKKLLK